MIFQDLYKTVCDGMWRLKPPEKENVLFGGVKKKAATVGVYRGSIVVIRTINKRSVDLNRTILKELTTVSTYTYSELRENI